MFNVEVIGNLGANAERKAYNGRPFVTFRVAHSNKWTNRNTGEITEETIWVSCILNGDGGALFPYLKKGTKVFVRGMATLSVFSSPKTKSMQAGVNLNVHEVELCGSTKDDGSSPQDEQSTPSSAQDNAVKNDKPKRNGNK